MTFTDSSLVCRLLSGSVLCRGVYRANEAVGRGIATLIASGPVGDGTTQLRNVVNGLFGTSRLYRSAASVVTRMAASVDDSKAIGAIRAALTKGHAIDLAVRIRLLGLTLLSALATRVLIAVWLDAQRLRMPGPIGWAILCVVGAVMILFAQPLSRAWAHRSRRPGAAVESL